MKKPIIIIIVAVVIIGIVLFVITTSTPREKHIPYYTEEPETWVSNVENYEITDKVKIDVEKMTKGDSVIDDSHQRYIVEGNIEGFFYHSFYKGNPFRTEYLEPIFYNLTEDKTDEEVKQLREEYLRMKISTDLQAGDGVIEGIIVARRENDRFVFYIFVDEDWKNKLEFTNIIWGDELDKKETLHVKNFDFSNYESGIYIEKLETDVDWFYNNPSTGGIVVGETTINDVAEDIIEDKTYMYIR